MENILHQIVVLLVLHRGVVPAENEIKIGRHLFGENIGMSRVCVCGFFACDKSQMENGKFEKPEQCSSGFHLTTLFLDVIELNVCAKCSRENCHSLGWLRVLRLRVHLNCNKNKHRPTPATMHTIRIVRSFISCCCCCHDVFPTLGVLAAKPYSHV